MKLQEAEASVFARVSSEHKLRIVEAYRRLESQGVLEALYYLQKYLSEITGMDRQLRVDGLRRGCRHGRSCA